VTGLERYSIGTLSMSAPTQSDVGPGGKLAWQARGDLGEEIPGDRHQLDKAGRRHPQARQTRCRLLADRGLFGAGLAGGSAGRTVAAAVRSKFD